MARRFSLFLYTKGLQVVTEEKIYKAEPLTKMQERFNVAFNNTPLAHTRLTLVDPDPGKQTDPDSQEAYERLFYDPNDKRRKFFAWAADKAGCGYYRVHQPVNALNATTQDFHGVVYNYDRRLIPKWADKELDVPVFAQRIANPITSVIWHELATKNRTMIFDLDDDLWEVPYTDTTRSDGWKFWHEDQHRWLLEENIRRSTMLTVSTTALAQAVADRVGSGRKYCPPIFVIPNAVPDKWFKRAKKVSAFSERTGGVTIGWAGSPTHEQDFSTINEQLRRFLIRNGNVEFHVMGTNYGQWLKIPKDRVRFTPWVSSVDEYHKLIDFDIGILPLYPNLFNRSKSPIKFLECATRLIPCIAADVGPYAEIIEHGVNGLKYKFDWQFTNNLRALVNDEDMRQELGANARKTALQYVVSKVVRDWKAALKNGAGMEF